MDSDTYVRKIFIKISVWHVPSSGTSLFPVIVVSTHGDVSASTTDDFDSGGARVGIGILAIMSSAKKLLIKRLIPDG